MRIALYLRWLTSSFHQPSFWLLLLPMVSIRFYTEQFFPSNPVIFLGVLSDIAVAGVFTIVVSLINHRHRGYLLFVLLPGINYLIYWNYEHILANGSNMSVLHVSQAADIVFIESSLMNPTNPVLLAALFLLAFSSAYLLRRYREYSSKPYGILLVAASVVILISQGQSRLIDGWRGYNFVEENFYWLLNQDDVKNNDAVSRLPLQLVMRNQLEGKPILAFPKTPTNVLLILLEGISGHMINPAKNGTDQDPKIPKLTQLSLIAGNSLYYSQFVNTQRQTNRGQYAILCGDQPKLTSSLPKMVQYARTGGPPCLPQVLHEAGYDTTYMQSAPLTYMYKSEFMPRAGFRLNLDDQDYGSERVRGTWGIDDMTLFKEARTVIQTQQTPWMLTLLTVGTHHPYSIPDMEPGSTVSFNTAAESMDKHLGEFWNFLQTTGVLENTLVIITSDESVGQTSARQPFLSQAWGFAIVSVPATPRSISRLYNQTDIAISVLDYLGLESRSRFKGRSLFRDYESGNMILFANTYLRQFALLEEGKNIIRCTENLDLCSQQAINGSIFDRVMEEPVRDTLSSADQILMRELISWNNFSLVNSTRREVDLTSQIDLQQPGLRLLLGGQSLSTKPGDEVNIELRLNSTGTPDSRTYVRVELKESASTDSIFKHELELKGNSQLPLEFHHQFDETAEGVELVIFAGQISGDMTVSTTGRMTISNENQ